VRGAIAAGLVIEEIGVASTNIRMNRGRERSNLVNCGFDFADVEVDS